MKEVGSYETRNALLNDKTKQFLLQCLSVLHRYKCEFVHFIMKRAQHNSILIWLRWLHYKLILEMYRLLRIEQCIICFAGNMTNGFQRSIAHELRNFARREYLRYT